MNRKEEVVAVAVAGRLAVITVVAELALMVMVEVAVEVHRTKIMSSDDLE